MQWLGRGPYHVWKNRLKDCNLVFGIKNIIIPSPAKAGTILSLKAIMKMYIGQRYHRLKFLLSIYFGNENMFFQLLKTNNPEGAYNTNTTVNYPEGNIGIMNAIQPIGTKFKKAEEMGPQSQKNVELNSPYEGVIWLDFR